MHPESATIEASESRRRPDRWDRFRSAEGEARGSEGAIVGPNPHSRNVRPTSPGSFQPASIDNNASYRDHNQRRDTSSYMRLSAPICQPNIQMIWNANSTQDVTLHFELDIEPDLESCMVNFRQLLLFGRFKSAEQCLEETLLDHIQEPIVTLGIAEMLLQQGAYGRLIDLCQEYSTWKAGGVEVWERETDTLSSLRQRCISMIFWIGRFNCLGGFESMHQFMPELKSHSNSLFYNVLQVENDLSMIYLEYVRLACYCFQVIGILGSHSNCLEDKDSAKAVVSLIHGIDLSSMYHNLHRHKRMQEARVVFQALVSTIGAERTWTSLFDLEIYGSGAINQFIDAWPDTDKETRYGLFDMLVTVGRHLIATLRSDHEKVPLSGVTQNIVRVARECFYHAKSLANFMLETDPEVVQSRSYLEWILAQEELSSVTSVQQQRPWIGSQFGDAANFAGVKLYLGLSPLPVYAPRGVENPERRFSSIPEKSKVMLHTALRASKQLGDYRTEASILRELICHSASPADLFADLQYLQKNVQEDTLGGLQTCLSKYLFTSDRPSLQELKSELAIFDGLQASGYLSNNHVLVWCQRTVQMALSQSLDTPVEAETSRSYAKTSARTLPKKLRNFISRSDFSDTTGRASNLEFFGYFGNSWRKYSCDVYDSSDSEKKGPLFQSLQKRPVQPQQDVSDRVRPGVRVEDRPEFFRTRRSSVSPRSPSSSPSPPTSPKVTFSNNVRRYNAVVEEACELGW